MNMQQKIAVVTGSSKGLGYAIARKLGQTEGIRVVVTSRNEQQGLTAQERLATEGVEADYQTLDVASDESVEQFTTWHHCTGLGKLYSKARNVAQKAFQAG